MVVRYDVQILVAMRCTEAQKMKKKISEVFSKKLEILQLFQKQKKKKNQT